MPWTYVQTSGALFDPEGRSVADGYSGAGDARNNPAMQSVPFRGPIPVGRYAICAPEDTVTHGPYVLPLTPFSTNEMFGRSGFLIHGDSLKHPGDASCGCIILGRIERELIWGSSDHEIDVIATLGKPEED